MLNAGLQNMRMMSNLFDYVGTHQWIGAVALALLVVLLSCIAIAERTEGGQA